VLTGDATTEPPIRTTMRMTESPLTVIYAGFKLKIL
jgi:hypothetical protein